MDPTKEQLEARRAFFAKAGKLAIITPAVITGLLSVSHGNYAMAVSGSERSRGNNGFGNGANDGIPGNSAGKGANGAHGPITDKNR